MTKQENKNHKDLAVIRDKEILSNFDIMRINEYSVEEIEAFKHAITTACFCMDFTAMSLFPGQILVDDEGKAIVELSE